MTTEGPTLLDAGGTNAVGRMLSVLGDQWNLLILQQAQLGCRRYGDFAEKLPISSAVLSDRLRALGAEGLLERRLYQESPPRLEYVLTPRGWGTWTVLLLIWDWERTHASPPRPGALEEELPEMLHVGGCGATFTPRLSCSHCHGQVHLRHLLAPWGPSGSWERSVPTSSTRRNRASAASNPIGLFPDTMAIVGDRFAVMLLGAAMSGLSRFGEFQSALAVPPATLAARLKTFVAAGVLCLDDDTQYRLTAKGEAFFGVVTVAVTWGQRWYVAPEGPAIEFGHALCGETFTPRLRCDGCGEELRGTDVAPSFATLA